MLPVTALDVNMNKSIIIAFLLAIVLAACNRACPSAQAVVTAEPTESEPKCTHEVPLTNEEIIRDTKMCIDAGLGAQSYHCGDNPFTVYIECTPTQ